MMGCLCRHGLICHSEPPEPRHSFDESATWVAKDGEESPADERGQLRGRGIPRRASPARNDNVAL